MKVSDELKEALDKSGHPIGMLDEKFKSLQVFAGNAIPRIEALERENEELKKQIDLHIEMETTP